MQEREDWRAGNIASAIYNVNIVEKSDKVSGSDFAFPSMEEIISREREMEMAEEQARLEAEAATAETESAADSDVAQWNTYIERLTAGRKPMQVTVNG